MFHQYWLDGPHWVWKHDVLIAHGKTKNRKRDAIHPKYTDISILMRSTMEPS
uniref:Uncharacterized protein n=1 Tax=Rhizophora mucronata TaxID=61149 RepID=A0A2P2NQ15_RHIMU